MSDSVSPSAFQCDITMPQELQTPWLFGVSLDFLLFGVLTVQTYVYYLAFPKDRKLLKLAVIWVYLVGVVQTTLAMVDLNADFMLNDAFQNGCGPFAVGTNHFWLTAIAFSAAAALTAQWLYAYRIYVVSRKLWIAVLVVCLSLGQLGTNVVGCICLELGQNLISSISNSNTSTSPPFPLGCGPGFGWVWGPLNFLCDVTITVSMSILLLKRRKGTLKKTTHAHITRVVRLVVETGLATSVWVVIFTLTYNLPSAPIPLGNYAFLTAWFVPGLTMGKVYSNSMLALLNSRLTIIGGRNTGDPFDNSEIRSEVLRTEVGVDQMSSTVTRRRTTNEEIS